MKAYRLKLKRLDFISGVDAGAQGHISNVALLKRDAAGGIADIEAVCNVVKVDAPMGLVFGWCLATTTDGGKTPHIDLQGDAVTGDDELIKIAAEFMESGAASDVMHDGDIDGRIVFAMPLVPEVNKALGIESNVHGLAIAMKPSIETFKRFQSGELRAFSIAGLGERTPLEKRDDKPANVTKALSMLECALGHTHFLDDGDGAMSGYTDFASVAAAFSANGYGVSHQHPWQRINGVICVGEAEGHCHEFPSMNEAETEKALGKSSPSREVRSVTIMTEADFNKRLTAISKSLVAMSADHFAYAKTLGIDDVEAFVTKSIAEREVIVKAADAADPIMHTTSDGIEIRKSAGEVAIRMAKRADAQAKQLADQQVEIEKSVEQSRLVQLEKRADADIKHFSKAVGPKVALLKAIDGIADDKVRGEVVEMLKAADVAMRELTVAKGYSPTLNDSGEGSANAKFNAALTTFAKSKNKTEAAATADFLRTAEGSQLYAATQPSTPSA